MKIKFLVKDSDGDFVLIGVEALKFGFMVYLSRWPGQFPYRLSLSHWGGGKGNCWTIGFNCN